MKYLILASIVLLSACAAGHPMDPELAAHLEAERDFAMWQYHTKEAIEQGYDPEYVDDCYYYEELICGELGETK
jgi:hypothetical protein